MYLYFTRHACHGCYSLTISHNVLTMTNDPATLPMGTDAPTTPPRVVANLQPPTPIVAKSATSEPFASTPSDRKQNIDSMWREISGKIVGPMPAGEFFRVFLTPVPSPAPAFNAKELNKMMKAKGELSMYSPFVSDFCHFSCSCFCR